MKGFPTQSAPAPAADMREALLGRTIEAVSLEGLEGITLRSIASAAGCSTAGVFQHFAGKAQLIEAALDRALQLDRDFHAEFVSSVAGLSLDLDSMATLISAYVEIRAATAIAPFWSEILLKSAQVETGHAALGSWAEMRITFWASYLLSLGLDSGLAAALHTYILMEEVYAYALLDRVEYKLMLRETTRAFAERYFAPHPQSCQSAVSEWASAEESQYRIDDAPPETNALKERLIAYGIAEIIEHGIPGMNLRKIAKRANASLSMIAYHFGDTENFVNESVWRALIQDIPHEIDPNRTDSSPLGTIGDWTEILAKLIRPHQGDRRPGFYVGVARLIGQAALFARRKKDLLPLILHLRKIEGSGTYRASQTIWPKGFMIERSAATVFGIWVKGQAVLNEAVASHDPAIGSDILKVASYLYWSKDDERRPQSE